LHHVALLRFSLGGQINKGSGEKRAEVKGKVSPERVRACVCHAIELFPHNTQLVVYLIDIEMLGAAWGRLCRALDLHASSYQDSGLWLQALRAESLRGARCYTIHRIRYLIEKACASSENKSAPSCPLLWRVYIAFEMEASRPEAARRVFFRAINSCPWSKSVWLDGFRLLRNFMSPVEMSELLDVMKDKEIRLRTDIYEILLMEAV